MAAPNLLALAQARYPAIRAYTQNLAYRNAPPNGTADKLEFYPRGEPTSFHPSTPAVETYGNRATPTDVAGDVVSHYLGRGVSPMMTQFYDQFVKSLTPKQTATLHGQYQWSRQNEGETRPYQQWANVTGQPAYFRGLPFGQWPASFTSKAYTPEQTKLLGQLVAYLQRPR